MPRQYLINIIYTIVGEAFKNWVDERVNVRHEKIKDDGKKMIEMDPEIAAIYQKSKAISTSNGKMYQLFKESAKPRRTKAEIKEARLQEDAEKLEIELKLKRFEEMQQELEGQQNQIQNQQRMENQMNHLIDQGLVKQDIVGGWVAVDSLEEQQAVLQHRDAEA